MGRPPKERTEEYLAECKKRNVAKTLKHRAANREKINAYRRKYAQEHPEKIKGYMQKWYYKNHEQTLQYHKNYREVLRDEIIEAYGGKCECCGETTREFLTVDHIPGYYNMHPDKRGPRRGGTPFYLWLRTNGFPKEDFNLLCWNCNVAKFRHGKCPHQQRE